MPTESIDHRIVKVVVYGQKLFKMVQLFGIYSMLKRIILIISSKINYQHRSNYIRYVLLYFCASSCEKEYDTRVMNWPLDVSSVQPIKMK